MYSQLWPIRKLIIVVRVDRIKINGFCLTYKCVRMPRSPDWPESELDGVKSINLGLVAEGTKKSVRMLRKSGLVGVEFIYVHRVVTSLHTSAGFQPNFTFFGGSLGCYHCSILSAQLWYVYSVTVLHIWCISMTTTANS